ncbi:Disease resistance protein RGA2 [Camellia lanceoleosa]|nr:Disease resistance protein RGA2 [Camellia lanceoleosa]
MRWSLFRKRSLTNLTLLKSLRIVSFSNIKVLPKDLASLVALISLSIDDCPELESLPKGGIQGFESLQSLHIDNCTKIASLLASSQNLTKLQSIDIWGFNPELARRCADAMLLGHNDSMMAANFEVVMGIRCIVAGKVLGC